MTQTDPACGNGPRMSRRTLLAALPAAAAAGPATAGLAEDPVLPVFRDWLDAKRTWRALADLPGNEDWDDPRSIAAAAREDAAEVRMLELGARTPEGIAALATLVWDYIGPATFDPEKFALKAASRECRAVMAIWQACTGQTGYPLPIPQPPAPPPQEAPAQP